MDSEDLLVIAMAVSGWIVVAILAWWSHKLAQSLKICRLNIRFRPEKLNQELISTYPKTVKELGNVHNCLTLENSGDGSAIELKYQVKFVSRNVIYEDEFIIEHAHTAVLPGEEYPIFPFLVRQNEKYLNATLFFWRVIYSSNFGQKFCSHALFQRKKTYVEGKQVYLWKRGIGGFHRYREWPDSGCPYEQFGKQYRKACGLTSRTLCLF